MTKRFRQKGHLLKNLHKRLAFEKVPSSLIIKKIKSKLLWIEGASPVSQMVKNLPVMEETWLDPWVRKIPWRRECLPTPVFSPGEFHG